MNTKIIHNILTQSPYNFSYEKRDSLLGVMDFNYKAGDIIIEDYDFDGDMVGTGDQMKYLIHSANKVYSWVEGTNVVIGKWNVPNLKNYQDEHDNFIHILDEIFIKRGSFLVRFKLFIFYLKKWYFTKVIKQKLKIN